MWSRVRWGRTTWAFSRVEGSGFHGRRWEQLEKKLYLIHIPGIGGTAILRLRGVVWCLGSLTELLGPQEALHLWFQLMPVPPPRKKLPTTEAFKSHLLLLMLSVGLCPKAAQYTWRRAGRREAEFLATPY